MKKDAARKPFTGTVVMEEEPPKTDPAPARQTSLTGTVVLDGAEETDHAPATVPIEGLAIRMGTTAILDPAEEIRQARALLRAARQIPPHDPAASPTSTGAPFQIAKPSTEPTQSPPREAPWREPQAIVQPAGDALVRTVVSSGSRADSPTKASHPIEPETTQPRLEPNHDQAPAPVGPVYGAHLPEEDRGEAPPSPAPKPVARVAERKSVGASVYSNFKKR